MLFNEIKRRNESDILKVLKEFLKSISCIFFSFFRIVSNAALFKNIIKSKSRGHFVKFNFANANDNIIFERDDKRSIVLIGNVK